MTAMIDEKAILLGATPAGKEIYYARVHGKGYSVIQFGTGGRLPAQLEGMFTSVITAQQATNAYLDRVANKEITEEGQEVKLKGKKADV